MNQSNKMTLLYGEIMKIYDYGCNFGLNNKRRKEITTEYISSKLENMDDSEDGIDMYWIKKYRREAIKLKNNLEALGYIVNLKENEDYTNLVIWKYKK